VCSPTSAAADSRTSVGDLVDSVRYMRSWKIKMIKVLRVHIVIVYLVAILCEVKYIIPESTHSNCVTKLVTM
jgi:t-SNARE complex subunit (syntaxin)